jgi:hypothetical protein
MAFVLKRSESYTWPVTVDIPIDGGRFKRESFDVEFARLPQTRVHELQIAAAKVKSALERGYDLEGLVTDQEIASEIVVGWNGILDEDGEEIKFSQSSKTELLDIAAVAAAIVSAFSDSISKAKAKN